MKIPIARAEERSANRIPPAHRKYFCSPNNLTHSPAFASLLPSVPARAVDFFWRAVRNKLTQRAPRGSAGCNVLSRRKPLCEAPGDCQVR